ncbi:MAG: hypothetical protein ACI8XC_004378, partial [Gammaproteobacteria bacterium]
QNSEQSKSLSDLGLTYCGKVILARFLIQFVE